MPAVTRSAQPRPGRTAAPKRAGQGGGRPQARAAYAPSKLNGVGAVGLKPKLALLAAVAVLAGGVVLTLATGGRGQAVAATIGVGADRSFAALGFKVAHIHVQGASSVAQPYVLRAAGLEAGTPSLGLDLSGLRQRVEQVGYVKSAKVVRLLPDTLMIAVTERPRLAVWQHAGQVSVVDDHGQVIPEADPGLFSNLPMVVGEGANAAAAAVLPLVLARPRLMHHLEALVRVDSRRWDLRLKDGSLIQLPATGEDAALIQLDQLDQRSRLLELGFERIDLRDSEMVAVRPRQTAASAVAAPTAPRPAAPI